MGNNSLKLLERLSKEEVLNVVKKTNSRHGTHLIVNYEKDRLLIPTEELGLKPEVLCMFYHRKNTNKVELKGIDYLEKDNRIVKETISKIKTSIKERIEK